MGHEYGDVEKPFIDQCVAMGWTAQLGTKDDPTLSGRTSFKEVIAEATLRERLRAINPARTASHGSTTPACRRPSARLPATAIAGLWRRTGRSPNCCSRG